jgi:hypothetical protein
VPRVWHTSWHSGWFVANEVAWHVYEAGKGARFVFATAALCDRAAPRRTRLAWALVAWRDGHDRPRLRAAVLVLLFAGNFAQLVVTHRFFATPRRLA